jgi:hypothetical protein
VSTPSGSRPDDGQAQDAAGGGPTDPDAIKADIEATREQLGRTVDELSDRLDVPARAKEGAFRVRDTAVEAYRESPSATVAGAAGVLAALVALVTWRAKRRRAASRAATAAMAAEVRAAAKRAAAEDRAAAARAAAKQSAAVGRRQAKQARKAAKRRRTVLRGRKR